jgi:hypothetical protein
MVATPGSMETDMTHDYKADRPTRTCDEEDFSPLVAIPFKRPLEDEDAGALLALLRAFEPIVEAVGEVVIIDVASQALVVRASAKACAAFLTLLAEAQAEAPVESPLRLLMTLGAGRA